MQPTELEELVRKFLRGNISEKEKARLFEWYAFPPEQAQPEFLHDPVNRQLTEQKIFNQISTHIGLNEAVEATLPEATTIPLSRRHSVFTSWQKIAASILLVLSLGAAGGYWIHSQQAGNQLSSYTEIEVQTGKKKTILLSDGSRLHINGKSKVRYPKDFSTQRTREVYLSGEAYFEVAKDSQKPFVVSTGNAHIEVVGTAFNVKEIAMDTSVVVAVTEGKVSVRQASIKAEDAVLITVGQVATLLHTGDIDTMRAEVKNYLGWLNGWLTYKQVPLPEVLHQLEQLYGVKIRLQDPALAHEQLTATIQFTSLTEILDLITATWGVGYEQKRGEILIGKAP